MSDQPTEGLGPQVIQTRVYYEIDSGEIVRVHRLVAAADESLDDDRVESEMALLELSLRERSSARLDYLIVDPSDLEREGAVRVDVKGRRLLRNRTDG